MEAEELKKTIHFTLVGDEVTALENLRKDTGIKGSSDIIRYLLKQYTLNATR